MEESEAFKPLLTSLGELQITTKLPILLDGPMPVRASTTAATGAAGAYSALGTALNLDYPKEMMCATSAEVSEDDDVSTTYQTCKDC